MMPPLAFDGDRGRGQKGTPNELRQGDCQAMDHNGSFGICLQGLHRPGQVVRFSAHDLAIHSAWVPWRKPGSCPVLGAICHYHEPTPFWKIERWLGQSARGLDALQDAIARTATFSATGLDGIRGCFQERILTGWHVYCHFSRPLFLA